MGTYLGYVSIINYHYNFKPIAKVEGSLITSLTRDDQVALLPESSMCNIEFTFFSNDKDQVEREKRAFPNASLVLFDFELSDLNDNIDLNTNQRKLTGYSIPILNILKSKRIRQIHVDNIYHVIQKEYIISDFYNDCIVDINTINIAEGD